MSGPRPAHLGRRGAIYIVRFRIPVFLRDQLGMAELSRSLHTSDHRVARVRCLRATCWFHDIVDKLGRMTAPSRSDLERAAVAFFDGLATEVEQREGLDLNNLAAEIDFNLAESRRRIGELDAQLSANTFDGTVAAAADSILSAAGKLDDVVSDGLPLFARQLAARAEREQLALLVHKLIAPGKIYSHSDRLFARADRGADGSHVASVAAADTVSLKEASGAYLKRKLQRGLSPTHIDELKRALGWLEQRYAPSRMIGSISKVELARFRDDVGRLDCRMRGRGVRFDDRLS